MFGKVSLNMHFFFIPLEHFLYYCLFPLIYVLSLYYYGAAKWIKICKWRSVGDWRGGWRSADINTLSLMWLGSHQVIKAVVPAKYLDDKTIYHLQPSGRFVIGGPQVCANCTRATTATTKCRRRCKQIVQPTGWCWRDRQEDHCGYVRRLGGSRRRSVLRQRLLQSGPFCRLRRPLGGQVSGQSQAVQESSGPGECTALAGVALCTLTSLPIKRKQGGYLPLVNVLQVSYAIGVAHPLSISLFTYGSSAKTESELLQIVNKNFDLRPGVIVRWVFTMENAAKRARLCFSVNVM